MKETGFVNLQRVREFMEEKGYSEYHLAKEMGISYSYLFRVLRGTRHPGSKFIKGLLIAGMSPDDIFLNQPLTSGNKTSA